MNRAGIILLALGVTSIFIQNTFYGYVDAESVLHDSIFLPIGTIATIIGILLLCISVLQYTLHKIWK